MIPVAGEPELADKIRRGIGWSTLNNLVLRAGSFAVGIVLARVLTPEQFGVYAVALTVQTVLMTLADLGLSADLIRSSEPQRRAPSVGALGLVSGTVLALLMALSASSIAQLMGSPESTTVIALLSVTLVLAGAGVVPYAMLQRDFRQRALFGIAAVDFALSTIATLLLLHLGWGVVSLAIGRIVAQLSTLVLQFLMSGVRPAYRFDREVVGSVLRFGVPLAGANMLSWALLNLDNVVIARAAGPISLGFYALAFNMSTWPMSAVGQVVRSVALPAFARTGERGAGLESLRRGLALTWALALPAGAALAVLAVPLVTVVYGERWTPAVPVLAALGLFGALRVVFDLVVAFLLARGASRPVLWIQALWFVTLLAVMVPAVRWFGIAGGGWAHLAVSVGVILPAYLLALRREGVAVGRLLLALWPPVPAAVAAGLGGSWVVHHVDSPALALVLGATAGAALYAGLVFRWVLRLLGDREKGTVPEPPRVSVVIPCFNYATFLPEAVHSALEQQGCDVEVIVVDDASTDASGRVADRLAREDPRVRVLHHLTNQGPVATFNDGLAVATGEFLVRLDADDLLTPGSLARSAAVCRARPDVGLVYGHPVHFHAHRRRARGGRSAGRVHVWRGTAWLELLCRTGTNVITSPEAFMRMSVVRRVGGQQPLAHTHDMEMWMRLAAFSDVAYLRGVDQAWHREHPASLSRRAESPLGLTILEERWSAFEVLFSGPASALPQAGALRDLARQTLAGEALRRASYEYDRRRAPSRDVAPLRDFALRLWPASTSMPEWRALEARRQAGRRWATRRPWLRLRPLPRILDDWWCMRRWARSGVFRVPRDVPMVGSAPLGAHHPAPPVSELVASQQSEGAAT
ncbi:oligosaccharide flippase family protein [Nocardioides sp. MAHUQ-72]|uniref:oligosaccharide flippase family protein n=1 Tax=unclassified Nocardioides TaxID=2615069 RepID=UPI00361544B0